MSAGRLTVGEEDFDLVCIILYQFNGPEDGPLLFAQSDAAWHNETTHFQLLRIQGHVRLC
jgi:hypothetical protein